MLQFRPHHFLCTLGFEGKGYSEEFVRNFSRIADALRASEEGDRTPIRVVPGSDSICDPCPNRLGETCESELRISALDRAHAAILGLVGGQVITWGAAKRLIAEKMSVEDHHRACAPCSWRALGVCEAALVRLQERTDE